MSIYRMATVDVPTYTETASDGYTKLLLHCDGTNGSTTFTDKTGKVVTAYGNAQISTAQSKFRGASAKLDGNGDYLSLASSADFNCSGDFTFDCWINPSSWSASYNGIFVTAATGGFWIGQLSVSGRFGLRIYGGSDICYTTTLPSLNVWTHVAIVRSGTTIKLYINGASVATATSSNAFPTASAYIGNDGGTSYFNGYVDELRFSKGIARWTANFTPPTAPYDTTITQTPTNTNVQIKSQYRGLSGVNRQIKEQYRGYGGVNRKVFSNWNGEIYDSGNEFIEQTGGWTSSGSGTLTKQTGNLYMAVTSNGQNGNFYTSGLIDFTNYTKLKFDVIWQWTNQYYNTTFLVTDNPMVSSLRSVLLYGYNGDASLPSHRTVEINIADLDGSHHVLINNEGGDVGRGTTQIFKVWLE